MDKIFTVKWQDKVELCKGYSHACEVALNLMKDSGLKEIHIDIKYEVEDVVQTISI